MYTQRPTLTKEQEELLAREIKEETPEVDRQKREALQKELKRPTSALFRTPGVEFWTRLIEGEFPDYQQVLRRSSHYHRVIMPKAPLIAALKACLACAPKDRLGVSLTRLPTGVRVRLEATDNGHVERIVQCTSWKPSCSVGLNARYTLQALECVRSCDVTLFIKGQDTPVFLEDGEFEAAIMPVRIAEPSECRTADRAADDQLRHRSTTIPSKEAPLSSPS